MSTKPLSTLIRKYDVPAPRYTSYPTVPYWENVPTTDAWITELKRAYSNATTKWSMYLHLPFCESLCTFCGCNNSITRDHKREEPYVSVLLKEWELYLQRVPEILQRPLEEI